MEVKLYDYWRSSAAYRVRIALNVKQANYEQVSINIKPGDDEQTSTSYRRINPQMRVPSIEIDGDVSGQSVAIMEWIEEAYPEPPLLPKDPMLRMKCRAFAHVVACDIHPLNNLSVLQNLRQDFGADDEAINRWYANWIDNGFAALETLAAGCAQSGFLFGEGPSFAEICLIPQMYNARRFNVDLSGFPRLVQVDELSRKLPAFEKAAPENQPSAA